MIPKRTVERFFKYGQFLRTRQEAGHEYVFSHELAATVGVSPEQVRRDLMNFSLNGTPQRGYPIGDFITELGVHLESGELTKIVLVGAGNLGKAILSYFNKRRPNLCIVAAFDSDPQKVNRVLSGCQVYHVSQLERLARQHQALAGIITVPATSAQETADALVRAGIRGIVNFAPANIRLPRYVFMEHLDITLSLEKTVYFARWMRQTKEPRK